MATTDHHVHLWAHAPGTPRPTTDRLARLVHQSSVAHVVIAEHFYRFQQARAVVGRFWEVDADETLRAATERVVAAEQTADLEAYVEGIRRAQQSGVPVSLGLEVDYFPGCAPAIRSMIEDYRFDIVLGSVHWIGAWLFDAYDDPTFRREWSRRGVPAAWDGYVSAFEELCREGWCDVLAHCDVIKAAGLTPDDRRPWETRLAEAAIAAGVPVELSSAGWRKPIGEPYPTQRLLERLIASGVPIVFGSDAHEPSLVGDRFAELALCLARATSAPS